MAGDVVGRAFIEIIPDFKQFASQLRQDLQTNLKSVEGTVRATNSVIQKEFGSTSRSIKTSLDGVSRDSKSTFGRIAEAAGESMVEVGIGVATAVRSAFTSLPPAVAPVVIAAAGAVALAFSSAVAAAISAGILLALGGGVIAAGIATAMKDPAVSGAFGTLKETAKNSLRGFTDAFKGPLVRAFNTIGAGLERMAPTFTRIGESMAPIVEKLAPALVKMFENALPGIEEALNAAKPLFDTLAKHAPAIGTAISKFFSIIATSGPVVTTFFDHLLTFIEYLIPSIAMFIAGLASQYQIVVTVVRGARDIIIAVWNGIKSAFSTAWNSIKSVVSGGVKFVTSTWSKLKELPGKARAWFEQVRSAIASKITAVINKAKEVPGKIKGFFSNAKTFLTNAGRNVIQGLIDGIKNMIGKVKNAIGDIVQVIRDHLPFSPARIGPLSGKGNPILAGRKIAQMLAGGISSEAATIQDAIRAAIGPGVDVGVSASAIGRLLQPASAASITALPTPQAAPPEVRVFIGDRELTDMIRVEVSEGNRRLKRRATSGSGAAA